MEEWKTGLILEGGAQRGMFTAGILDVFLEEDIAFDGMIGVSAGAVFGCNFKSKQHGRTIRYNRQYAQRKEYGSFWSLIKTGDYYGAEFCYHTIPYELDLWDDDTYRANPMEFYVTATDVETGKPVYKKCDTLLGENLKWLQASASMPMLSRIVEVDGFRLLDGGVSDSVPIRFFESIGYNRNVVVLTQPEGYVKKPNPLTPVAKVLLRKTPNLLKAFADRHIHYNEMLAYIEEKEKSGEVLVIRPPEDLNISRTESDPDELQRVYEIGRKTGLAYRDRIREFIGKQV